MPDCSKPARYARRSRASSFIAVAALLVLCGCGRNQRLEADLAFNFTCSGASYPASEPAIEKFVASHGFTVFNEERVRRQYKLAMYPLAIDGFDARRRMLDFRGINEKSSDKPVPVATIYSVGLYSPPPTRHDDGLEKAMQDFVSGTLKCDISNVSRGDNGADRTAFFDKVYKAEQARIVQGMRCDRQSGRKLDTKCPN
ncbi:MAG TPA: hypothetical protein VLT91_06895 [Rhizomicrobium sp.]|nr:hypothetical protein [Rhizomicrobium sp.]